MAVSYQRLGSDSSSTRSQPSNKRYIINLVVVSALLCLLFVGWFRSHRPADTFDMTMDYGAPDDVSMVPVINPNLLHGPSIAPKLGNETAKAELGRAAWKLFHTTMARFPDKPSADDSESLRTYIHLFQRLYPCGECSQHFAKILQKFPPQVSSRSAAAAWGCHVHNEVNKSLKKELFDCSNIGDFYDCGCAEGDEKD